MEDRFELYFTNKNNAFVLASVLTEEGYAVMIRPSGEEVAISCVLPNFEDKEDIVFMSRSDFDEWEDNFIEDLTKDILRDVKLGRWDDMN